MKQTEIAVGRDEHFEWEIYEKALPVSVITAEVSFFDSDGELLQSSSASAQEGKIKATLLASNNTKLMRFGKAVLSVVHSTGSTQRVLYFDVVTHPIVNECLEEDLYAYEPYLRKKAYEYSGIASSAGVDSFSDFALADTYGEDFTGGRALLFVNGNRFVSVRIVDFDKTTATVYFSPSLESVPEQGMRYRIRASYEDILDKAFDEVRLRLRANAGLEGSFVGGGAFKQAVCSKALAIYWSSLLGTSEEADAKFALHEREYETNFKQVLSGGFDANSDGNISKAERKSSVSNISVEY